MEEALRLKTLACMLTSLFLCVDCNFSISERQTTTFEVAPDPFLPSTTSFWWQCLLCVANRMDLTSSDKVNLSVTGWRFEKWHSNFAPTSAKKCLVCFCSVWWGGKKTKTFQCGENSDGFMQLVKSNNGGMSQMPGTLACFAPQHDCWMCLRNSP